MHSFAPTRFRNAFRRARRLIPRKAQPAILMYHRIGDDAFDPWGLVVTPARFAEQIDWLTANRTVLPLTEFARAHRERRLPANAIALTFDDGYQCVAEIAAPMLAAARVPATVFLPAELVEREQPFWWDELESLVIEHDGDALSIDGERICIGQRHRDDNRWKPGTPARTQRQRAYQRIWNSIYNKRPAEIDSAMAALRQQSSADAAAVALRPMAPMQIRALASTCIDFGCHSLTHASLPRLSQAGKKKEVSESVDRCAALVGKRPTTFAYPFGDFDADCEHLVEQAGLMCACASIGDVVGPQSSLFALPRIPMENWSFKQMRRRFPA